MANSNFIKIISSVAAALFFVCSMCSCKPDDIEPVLPLEPDEETPVTQGVTDIDNPYADKPVSFRGETITIKFNTSGDWIAKLEFLTAPGDKWASIIKTSSNSSSQGGCSVRIAFDENETDQQRKLELWVTVLGCDPQCVCTLVQAEAGVSQDAKMNTALNTFMHDILKEDYLFADAYNSQEINLDVKYIHFLDTHLALGKANIEDGGYYRNSLPDLAGKRYIYTNIVEILPTTKASEAVGLGFGPFISTALSDGSDEMGIAPAYVRKGSPADAAGLRRGDIIYKINGVGLNTQNYSGYMTGLYQNPEGAYTFSFFRFEENGNGGYTLNSYTTDKVTPSSYIYNPVLHSSVLTGPSGDDLKIGYLVYEAFDMSSQSLLKEAISDFAEAGVTELILDLRFNAGGDIAQSRWLSGCIAGAENGEKTFTKVIYNDGSQENWTFDYGYTDDTDNLGKPTDLGLDRLFVITSYNTASAAELVISSLKGIDFPVKMIGGRTEGKNVGMTVSDFAYRGRRFRFSPVTFWVRNAKDWGDYQFGMEPDEYVNNDNIILEDDADNVFPYSFGDWDNMDYNIALQWAYCDITGKPRWTHAPRTKSSEFPVFIPMEAQPYAPQAGHFGNLIKPEIK